MIGNPPESEVARGRRILAVATMPLLLVVVLVFLLPASRAAARSSGPHLDRSFGRGGWTRTLSGTAGEGRLVELSPSPDGGAVVADLGTGQIVRLRPDGGLERRFGQGGVLSVVPATLGGGKPGSYFTPNSLAVDRAGRLVVFGEQTDPARSVEVPGVTPGQIPSSSAIVLRFDREGRRDLSFGGGKGYMRDDFGLASPLSSEVPLVGAMKGVVDSRNRPVLLAGVLSMTGACTRGTGVEKVPKAVVRLTTAGVPDPTFGSDGFSLIEGTSDFPQLQIAGRGQLVVGAGPSGDGEAECRNGDVIHRLDPDGEPSARFGTEGALSLAGMRLAALEPSGAVIVGRRRSHALLLSRFSATGRRDPGFGHAGIAKIDLPDAPGVEVGSVLVTKAGDIIVVGFSRGRPSRREPASFMVARISSHGKIDPNVGAQGWVKTKFRPPLEITSAQAKLDQQGRLVVAGTAATPGDPDGGFLVARYVGIS